MFLLFAVSNSKAVYEMSRVEGSMKKYRNMVLLVVSILCCILAGCKKPEIEAETTVEQQQEEGETLVGENDNLFQIPCEPVKEMMNPNVYLVKNQLMFAESIMDEWNSDLLLKTISLEDGSLLGEQRFFASGEAIVQFCDESIAVPDCAVGCIRYMDDNLNVQEIYEYEQTCDKWYLSPDKEYLYLFYRDQGICRKKLSTDQDNWILKDGINVEVCEWKDRYVIFSYIDKESQKITYRTLDLFNGRIQELSIDWNVERGYGYGETWLLKKQNENPSYAVVTEDKICFVKDIDGTLQLLGSRQHLLRISEDGTELSLYDINGTFLSGCSLEKDMEHKLSANFIWSGYRQGYFFTDTSDGETRLLFWNPETETQGENLAMESEEREENVEGMSRLQARAKAFSETYDVELNLGMDCGLEYSDYTATVLEDESHISNALDVLEACFQEYPEGFFSQLTYGTCTSLRIDIVESLKLREENTDGIEAGAFVQELEDYNLMVFIGVFLTPSTVHHEITHIVDNRLHWDAYLREDALFSEEQWLLEQPEGFDYAYSFHEISEETKSYIESGYFISEYSVTNPKEDRATLMEAAMTKDTYEFTEKPGLKKKLEYYSRCLRDCFDTSGWPEITAWEEILYY